MLDEVPPAPEGRPPSVHETIEYQRADLHHFEPENGLIPTTVTDLTQNNNKMIEDLYKILTKVVAENKNLKLSLSEQQAIIDYEVRRNS